MSAWPQNDFLAEAPPGAKHASHRPCVLTVALVAIFSISAWSQTQLATVSGTITDPSGAVVPGVAVTIVSQGTGLRRSAVTDTAGEFRFAGLPIGNYSLRMEKTGFQSQIRQGVDLTSAAEVMINSQLAIGDLSQHTTVSANIAGIDNTTTTVNGALPEQGLTELPSTTAIFLVRLPWSEVSLLTPAMPLRCFLAASPGKWHLMGYVLA